MKSFSARLLLLLLSAAVLVSACGNSTPPPKPSSSADQPVITGPPAGFNAADVAFATNMLANYGQTTQLTALVPDHSTNSDVIKLASDIGAAQQSDQEMMKVFLVQWNGYSDNDSRQRGGANAVTGTVDDATMGRLASLSGKEFDGQWLQSMISHQQAAISTAESEIANGTNVDAVATAKLLVATYQQQIGRMQQLLGSS